MGRTEKSQGLAPPAIRKDVRAKQARHIVNKIVPAILAGNTRARKGVEGSEVVVDPGADAGFLPRKGERQERDGREEADGKYIKRKGQGRRKAKRGDEDAVTPGEQPQPGPSSRPSDAFAEPPRALTIRILPTDTLTAARTLVPKNRNHPNPCVLNMASPLRPGGGVLAGATSQEEFLCARTTLLPSLKDSFYRLPERGAVFSRDVLVFRDHRPLGDARGELPVQERWWVDVVSAGMLRFPDLEGGEEEEKRLGARDRAAVEAKMRAVLRVAVGKGARRVVLGAWGCGAYGNPVRDVAEAWRAVLVPGSGLPSAASPSSSRKKGGKKMETWEELEEVVFAISSRKMARDFARAFGGVEVEEGLEGADEDEGEDETDEVAEELRAKIAEIEGQVEKVWNVELKQRMSVILEGLKLQLREREGDRGGSDEGGKNGEDDGTPERAETGGVGLSEDEEEVVHYSSDEWQVSPFD